MSLSKNFLFFEIITVLFAITFFNNQSFCQSAFSVKNSNDSTYINVDSNGKVSIDTSTALGTLTIGGLNGIISIGTYSNGTALNLGAGTRMMWYPKKAAFRAGYVDGTQWNDGYIGAYSFASGYNTIAQSFGAFASGLGTQATGSYSFATGWNSIASGKASFASGPSTKAEGDYSTALGSNTTASGIISLATGYQSTAIGYKSTAMGFKTNASGTASIALGSNTTASGDNSFAVGDNTLANITDATAMGEQTVASGTASTAMGYQTTASSSYATAMGQNSTASGSISTAMGYYSSTNSKTGSFVYGDASTITLVKNSAYNQFMVRATGGFVFYTGTNGGSAQSNWVGASLGANQTSWSTVSDSTKKYAFLPVDGDSILNKIDKFDLRTWSYKGQDSTKFRHYGPMAQEFYNAFGHDDYGVIGNDTTINQADFEGINLIAIQALERRTKKLTNVEKELRDKTKKLSTLDVKVNHQQAIIDKQQKQIKELNKMKVEFIRLKKTIKSIINSDTVIKTKLADKVK